VIFGQKMAKEKLGGCKDNQIIGLAPKSIGKVRAFAGMATESRYGVPDFVASVLDVGHS